VHGLCGLASAVFVLQEFNLPPPLVVEAQAQPDPEFPTVTFPNPEEGEGTWQMAFDTGGMRGISDKGLRVSCVEGLRAVVCAFCTAENPLYLPSYPWGCL